MVRISRNLFFLCEKEPIDLDKQSGKNEDRSSECILNIYFYISGEIRVPNKYIHMNNNEEKILN